MAKASGYAGEGEASGSAMTDGGGGGGGGGFELNSVTPTAIKNTIGVTAGGISGSNFFPRRPFGIEPNLIALGVSAAALVVVLILLRRRSA